MRTTGVSLPVLVVTLALAGVGCGAAQAIGASVNEPRAFEITNKSKSKVCEAELINEKQLSGPRSMKEKIAVEPGAKTTVKFQMPLDQERKVVFRDCKGLSLKEVAVAAGKEMVPVTIE